MHLFYSKLLLVFLLSSLFGKDGDIPALPHPLHVSTTELNYNEKTKSIEITSRIFTDDFESILAKNYKVKTDLSSPAMKEAMDKLIGKYMAGHLTFKVNGQAMTATYIGFEIDHEATNVYLEIEKAPGLQSLSVSNSLLYDLFDDQMSILHVENKGLRKSTRANYPNTKMEVVFK